MKVKYPEDHLYCRYQTQASPQGTHIELDPIERIMVADYDGNIGGGMSMEVYYGKIRQYGLPSVYLTQDAICELMDKIKPLCERVCDGFDTKWNGHNWIGDLTEDAQDAEEEIMEILGEQANPDDEIEVWDASEWLDPEHHNIIRRVVEGEDAEEVIDELIDERTGHRPVILDYVDHYVQDIENEIDNLEVYAVQINNRVVASFKALDDAHAKHLFDKHYEAGGKLVMLDVYEEVEPGTQLEIDEDGCATVIYDNS